MYTPVQEDQFSRVRDTGNGPTLDNEESYLRDKYGPADSDGVYGAAYASGKEDDES